MSVVTRQLKSINDCDAGDVVGLGAYRFSGGRYGFQMVERQVAMVIVAPRGRAVLFAPGVMSDYAVHSEAVRAFMEQHCDGR